MAPPSPTTDLLADLKNRTQRLAAEFERGAADRLQDLLGQPAGLLVRETEQALGSLQELQLEKKSKTMGARARPRSRRRSTSSSASAWAATARATWWRSTTCSG